MDDLPEIFDHEDPEPEEGNCEMVRKALRGVQDLTGKKGYAALAEVAGVTRGQPRRWEKDIATPRPRSLKILQILAEHSDLVDQVREMSSFRLSQAKE